MDFQRTNGHTVSRLSAHIVYIVWANKYRHAVSKGYFKDEEKTKEAFIDGWFHTGDIGMVDADGFLFITDRKKEMFKTSGGKYVAPQMIEKALKKSRFIEQVMVVGEGQKMPAALIQPNFDFVKK